MSNSRQPSMVVIGAGMAGLSAAWLLARAGVGVVVLEKDVRVGGRVYTDVLDGIEVDIGAQFFPNFYPYTMRLIREVGLRGDVDGIPGGAAILREGHLHRLWPNLRSLFTSIVSARSKVKLGKLLAPLVTHGHELDFHAFHKAHALDTCSIADYTRQQRLDEEVLEYLLQPSLSGIFYWTPEHTSQALLFTSLKPSLSMTGMKIYTFRHGMRQLPEALAARLPVLLNAEVAEVRPADSGGHHLRARVAGQELLLMADGVVCATTATAVPGLFPYLEIRQREFFEQISYSSTAAVAIGLERRLPADFYGLFFPRREAAHLAAATIQSAKCPARTPPGRDLVALYSSGPAGRTLLAGDDEFIRDTLVDELRRAGAAYDLREDMLFSQVYRWREALPEFDVGHFKRLNEFATDAIEPDRVVFAGDYLGGPFIEGAVTSGLKVARRLLARLALERR